jgi:hypothetical protein
VPEKELLFFLSQTARQPVAKTIKFLSQTAMQPAGKTTIFCRRPQGVWPEKLPAGKVFSGKVFSGKVFSGKVFSGKVKNRLSISGNNIGSTKMTLQQKEQMHFRTANIIIANVPMTLCYKKKCHIHKSKDGPMRKPHTQIHTLGRCPYVKNYCIAKLKRMSEATCNNCQ